MTGDDVGHLRDKPDDIKLRARQNVILELGWAMNALGRRHVVVLHESGVEIPSDIHGVAYWELDAAGAWKARILGELKAVGVKVDVTTLL